MQGTHQGGGTPIIDPSITLADARRLWPGTMMAHLGIELTGVGSDFVCARMPVDERTRQPLGMLHGGASIALAETVGSVAANLVLAGTNRFALGLEVNGNHIRSVREGYVHARATPAHIGGKTHIWHIDISDDSGRLVCVSRLTMAVLEDRRDGDGA